MLVGYVSFFLLNLIKSSLFLSKCNTLMQHRHLKHKNPLDPTPKSPENPETALIQTAVGSRTTGLQHQSNNLITNRA